MIQKIRLGRTGLTVSKWSLGGIPLSTVMGANTEEVIEEVIHKALDAGINFIDTARVYMDSETNIGKVMAARRKECFLATKSHMRKKDEIMIDLETSLQELRTDTIDLFQVHDLKKDDLPLFMGKGGGMEAFLRAKEQGMTRFIGITSHDMYILAEMIKTGEFDTAMFPFNVIEREAEKEVIPLAREKDIGTLVMKPLGGGAISNIEKSFRFFMSYPIQVILNGVSNTKELKENLEIFEKLTPLTLDERRDFEKEVSPLGKAFCRRCGYCLPCPNEIRVPEMIQNFWQTVRGWTYEKLSDEKRVMGKQLLVWLEACEECGQCEEKCPYNLPIIDHKKELVRMFSREEV